MNEIAKKTIYQPEISSGNPTTTLTELGISKTKGKVENNSILYYVIKLKSMFTEIFPQHDEKVMAAALKCLAKYNHNKNIMKINLSLSRIPKVVLEKSCHFPIRKTSKTMNTFHC